MTAITIQEVTTGAINGTGTFDVLMRTVDTHIQEEHSSGRITGNDYATVYLGALQSTLTQAMSFVLQQQQSDKQAELLGAQVISSGIQDSLVTQQTLNLVSDELGIDANTALTEQQKANLINENLLLLAKTSLTGQQELNLVSEELTIDAKTSLTTQQELNLVSEELAIDAKTALTNRQVLNLVTDNTKTISETAVLDQQKTNLVTTNTKIGSESNLLVQKKVTEEAQTVDGAVAGVIGKQKALYQAQTDGFARDAEQKLSKIVADSWSVRRSTDETSIAPDGLDDTDIAQVLTKAAAGIGVTLT